MKIVIIGGSHAGIAACQFAKNADSTAEVILIEKSNVLGFIPSTVNLIFHHMIATDSLHLGEVSDEESLRQLGVTVLLNTLAIQVDSKQKLVKIQPTQSGITESISYDYLILAMGSEHFNITDANQDTQQTPLLTYKQKSQTEYAFQQLKNSSSIGIIGAGLIGLELANSLSKDLNKKITIIEQMNRPLFRYFDQGITDLLMDQLPETVSIKLLESFTHSLHNETKLQLQTYGGATYDVDTCVFAMNPKPYVDLVRDVVTLDYDETVLTDDYMQTSDSAIYAIGDLVRIPFGPQSEKAYLPLIGNARKTALVAINHIFSLSSKPMQASQRTIGTELFGMYLGSTGITKTEADFYDIDSFEVFETFNRFSNYHSPNQFSLTIKLVVACENRQLLGAQLITTRRDVLELINIFAQIIVDKKTVDDLVFSDMYYSPQLSPSRNFIAAMGLAAMKLP